MEKRGGERWREELRTSACSTPKRFLDRKISILESIIEKGGERRGGGRGGGKGEGEGEGEGEGRGGGRGGGGCEPSSEPAKMSAQSPSTDHSRHRVHGPPSTWVPPNASSSLVNCLVTGVCAKTGCSSMTN